MTGTIPNFVHLHVHTQHSLLDGAIRLDGTKEFGMDSVALTDHFFVDQWKFWVQMTRQPIKSVSPLFPYDHRTPKHPTV